MQFVIIAKDYKGSLEKRLAARNEHIALGDKLRTSGNYLYGVAMLNEKGEMNGSIMVMEYESQEKLEEWLQIEPYKINNVWETIEIIPCKVGPTFLK